MSIRPLTSADASCGAKAHGLARLAAAGLRVPDGFVIEPGVFRDVAAIDLPASPAAGAPGDGPPPELGHALDAAAQRIARAEIPPELSRAVSDAAARLGRLAVRSSASLEDGVTGAAPGVFTSLTDVAPGDVWPAIRAVWTSALAPLAASYARRRGAQITIAVIVQRFVPGERATVYTRPIGEPTGDELWLQRGGVIERVARDVAARRPELALALAAEAVIEPRADERSAAEPEAGLVAERAAPRGADVELVIEHASGTPWLVQARPIIHPVRPPTHALATGSATRSPPPPIVLAALVADGRRWTWDIAHNPDPLSPAQAGLVEQVDRTAWSPYGLAVCGGYLYTTPHSALPAPPRPRDRRELAARIADIEARLAGFLRDGVADREPTAEAFADVIARYLGFLQIWTCELSPLVRAARSRLLDRLADAGHPAEQIPALAAAMIGPRRAPRDPVMAPAWDVAVPTFAESRATASAARDSAAVSRIAPSDNGVEREHDIALRDEVELARAAADAAEHDDVWFARAQWMVRRALLARADEFGLAGDDIFWIPLDDVITLRTLDRDDVHRRASAARTAHARASMWDMPLVVHGRPVEPAPRDANEITLRGAGSGPRVVGRVVRFASLAAARPVARDEVIVTRAVTPSLAMIVEGCAALVSETGGLLDHGAALARELGIPCVVGCAGAWTALTDGVQVSVDGDRGVVRVLGEL